MKTRIALLLFFAAARLNPAQALRMGDAPEGVG
jgi:hypothetical protein